MAQHIVILLNQTVPQFQEPQSGDSYLLIADTEIQGDLIVTGNVNGRDIAADGGALDTALQPGANISKLTNDENFSDDQTGAEIKAALFGEADTNNFDDAAQTKLTGIATGAEVNPLFASQGEAQSGTENTKIMTALRVAQAIAVFSSGLLNKYDGTTAPGPTNDVNDGYSVGSIWMWQTATPQEVYRCVDNTAGVAVWIKTSLTIDELATVALSSDSDDLTEGLVHLLMTVAERGKLAGIEPSATADQTGAEIKSLYEAEADTNAFTDAAQAKVAWLEGVTLGITAFATGGQASAVELTTRFNLVETVASAGDSVKLPTAVAGKALTVTNKGANAIDLFPGSGDNIDGTGVDTAVSVAAGSSATLWAADATNWYYA
jgi:hypothetical protein